MLEVTFHDDFDHMIIICIANIFLFIDGGDGQIRFLLVWIWAGATNVMVAFGCAMAGQVGCRLSLGPKWLRMSPFDEDTKAAIAIARGTSRYPIMLCFFVCCFRFVAHVCSCLKVGPAN